MEISPTKFLDTQLVNLNWKVETSVTENKTNYPYLGPQTSLNVTREMQLMVIYIVQNELQQIPKSELYKLKRNS